MVELQTSGYNSRGPGTLVPNWVKVADKNKIVKVMKCVKIGFKVLQDIIFEVLSLNTATSIIKSKKNHQ